MIGLTVKMLEKRTLTDVRRPQLRWLKYADHCLDVASEGSATLASSSGTGAEAQLRGHREMNPDNIGA